MTGEELRQCGMGQLMKRNGISSHDGSVFICDQCNEFAADLAAVTGNIRWGRADDSTLSRRRWGTQDRPEAAGSILERVPSVTP